MQNDRSGNLPGSSVPGGAAGTGFGSTPAAGSRVTSAPGSTAAGGFGGTTGTPGAQQHDDVTVDQAKAKAQQLVSDATQRTTEEVQSRLESQKQRAAESLSSFAQSLRSSSQQMEGQPLEIGGYVQRAADQVDDLAYFLRERDVSEIVDRVEDFARRQPGLFLGTAFGLGVLGARFLKSSRRNLVREGVRERWSTREMTGRIDNPERDAVGRPAAPGYAPPVQRAGTASKPAGPRGT